LSDNSWTILFATPVVLIMTMALVQIIMNENVQMSYIPLVDILFILLLTSKLLVFANGFSNIFLFRWSPALRFQYVFATLFDNCAGKQHTVIDFAIWYVEVLNECAQLRDIFIRWQLSYRVKTQKDNGLLCYFLLQILQRRAFLGVWSMEYCV
jgi:hypothetical protein